MDVILRLLGFPGVFVGFGEGVCRDQQSRPHEKLEDASKNLGNADNPSCLVPPRYLFRSQVAGNLEVALKHVGDTDRRS